MELRKDEPRKYQERHQGRGAAEGAPKRRFRLVRLEERIAPAQGGVTSPHNGCLTPGANHNGFTTGL